VLNGDAIRALLADRHGLSCKHSLRGIDSRRCPECGRLFDPLNTQTTGPRDSWFNPETVVRAWRVFAWIVCILATISFLAALGGSDPFVARGSALLGLPILLPMVLTVFWCALSRQVAIRRWERIAGITAILVLISVIWTWWPFRITFVLFHKAEFTRIADQYRAEQKPRLPHRVGWYEVRSIKEFPWSIGLQVTGGAGGGTHFVRCNPTAERVWVNTNWEVSLGDGWYYVYED
jgi:hypothetical protein